MGRRPKNVNESGRWSVQVGEHGSIVRIREREPKGRLLLLWGDAGTGKRIQRYAQVETVRKSNGKVDGALEEMALREARDLAARLRIARETEQIEPARITLAQGFARFHDPRKGALPASKSARKHHAAARAFWCDRLGEGKPWNAILPAQIDSALKVLVEGGKIPTAEKHVRTLRTVTRWLRDRAGFDGLKDPTRHVDLRKLREGHEPRRPRYTRVEIDALLAVAGEIDQRFRFALIWADDTGARSAALYRARRSDVDCALDVPPKPEDAPHGWCRLPPLKGQRPALVYLTELQRQVLDEATGERWNGARMEPGYLSDLEQRWQEKGIDYPLIPGGPWPRSGVFTAAREISKGALDRWLIEAEKKAGVPRIARRGWHGIRRSWTDYVLDEEGMDTVVAAGAWSDEDMPRHVYAERIRHQHLRRSREAQERKRGPR